MKGILMNQHVNKNGKFKGQDIYISCSVTSAFNESTNKIIIDYNYPGLTDIYSKS